MQSVLEIVAAGIIVLVAVVAVMYLVDRWILDAGHPSPPGGFEVKPNAGATPVTLRKKDNDHG